jgi:hypothetical protein
MSMIGFKPRTILPLSLSYDHRIIDGADAAQIPALDMRRAGTGHDPFSGLTCRTAMGLKNQSDY